MDLKSSPQYGSWYTKATNNIDTKDILVVAYADAVKQFSADLTKDGRKIDFLNTKVCLQDVQDVVSQSLGAYEAKKVHTTARKWLHKVALRIQLYGNVLDVLAQHHPEYVALAWGAMKFLLQAAINHENILAIIPKALAQIADSLPRVELASILYPTERMKTAISELYAHILRFFVRARDWYEQGTLRRWVHSITRPAELRYNDLLEQICTNSRLIDQLAASGSQAEIRDMHNKLGAVVTELDRSNSLVNELRMALASFQSLSNVFIDTNRRVTDLQFAQIMSSLPLTSLGDPIKILQYHRSMQRRRFRSNLRLTSNRFWLSPKLQEWSNSKESSLSIVKGNFLSRMLLREFCVDVISELRSAKVPFLLAMKPVNDTSPSGSYSTVDLLKDLVRQALQLCPGDRTEKALALSCRQFQAAVSEADWFHLLEYIIGDIKGDIYVIIDIEILNQDLSPLDGFSLLSAFTILFKTLSSRGLSARVKVLFVSYGSILPFYLSDDDFANLVVAAKTSLTPARRQKRGGQQTHTPRLFRSASSQAKVTINKEGSCIVKWE